MNSKKLGVMKKIREEYNDLEINCPGNLGISLKLVEDNLFNWKGGLCGPRQTPYCGGFFLFYITFTENYPQEAPEVCFKTPIYHVNINPIKEGKNNKSLGFACNSTLNWWNPKSNMRNLLNNIFSLFFIANPEIPYSIEIAKEFINNKELYDKKARYFTKKYASPINSKYDDSKSWDFTYDE